MDILWSYGEERRARAIAAPSSVAGSGDHFRPPLSWSRSWSTFWARRDVAVSTRPRGPCRRFASQ